MNKYQIAFVNESTIVTDIEATKVMNALQKQVSNEFASAWGIDAQLIFYSAGNDVPLNYWQLIVLDNSDQAGALGYHDVTKGKLPLGKIFAGTDKQYGSEWSVTASHELLEMLGDPDINLTASQTNEDGDVIIYAYENCDACEADEYGYLIDGVLVSDFVYPSWFEQFSPEGTQFDYRNKITAPFQLLSDGYISIKEGNGWTQIYGQNTPVKYNMRPHVGSRRERRTVNRKYWLKSK